MRYALAATLLALGVGSAQASVTTSGGTKTIRHSLRVGARTVHWKTAPLPDQSTSEVYVRVRKSTLAIVPDSMCSGNATWRDLVVRVDGCGDGAAPLRVSAVRLSSGVPVRVRLEITVTAP